MNKVPRKFFYSLFVFVFLLACNTTKNLKNLVYLNDVTDTAQLAIVQRYEAKIQPADRLSINVSALNPASAIPYNLIAAGSTTTTTVLPAGYLVENDGTIAFPQLGRLKVAGLTRSELVTQLTGMLEKYLKDPIITVQYLNFKVTILGEVNRPGALALPDGKMNIIEAIGESGDLTIYGRRDNILVMREKDGKRILGRVDITSSKIFSSPFYQLQQNDVVYVEMTSAKVAASDQTLARNISLTASVVSVLSTLVFVIISLTR